MPETSSIAETVVDSFGNFKKVTQPQGNEKVQCWALTTGEAGMVSHVVGLAHAVGLPYELKSARQGKPYRWLPGHWAARFNLLKHMEAGSDPLTTPWPRLVISCGRRSAALAIAIKRASAGKVMTVHIQNPRTPTEAFDMVVPPEHDAIEGANVYSTRGELHKLTREGLDAAAEHFKERFAHLRRPLVAVLIGGKSRSYAMTGEAARELAGQLKQVTRQAGVIITASRRTGEANRAILEQELNDTDAWLWDGQGENPYFGMLALADHIIVTADSASMISEACFSGKPVYIAKLPGGNARFDRLHKDFEDDGMTRPFAGVLEDWSYTPLDECPRIAKIVKAKLEQRG